MYDIIVNPNSRSGRGLKLWRRLEHFLREEEIPFRVYLTSGNGHATQIAAKLTAPLSGTGRKVHLVVLGGDGTLNETVNGICCFENTLLSYIPTGSSNDFARALQLPKDPVKAFTHLHRQGREALLDTGLATYLNPDGSYSPRRFCVSSGLGFDAAVCEEVLRTPVKHTLNRIGLGKLVYIAIGIKQLLTAGYLPGEIVIDDAPPLRIPLVFFAAAMIHRYEGGGFMFCPDADPGDGLLDLCLVTRVPKRQLPLLLPLAFFGKHIRFSCVRIFRGRRIRVSVREERFLHTDGEVRNRTREVTFTCEKANLHLKY